jgi:hypothetical protein
MNREMIDLYSHNLIANFGQVTATSLANILDGEEMLKLLCLKLSTGLTHFALKAKLRLKAVRAAWDELDRLQDDDSSLVVKSA